MRMVIFILLLLLTNVVRGEASCFKSAGRYYNIDPVLLEAIAIVESKLEPNAIGYNRNAKGDVVTRDFGLMQINESHVKFLKKKGVIKAEGDLTAYPCLNIYIGASILSKHFSKCGVNWQCLGTYNSGFKENNHSKRTLYAKKIFSTYRKLQVISYNNKKTTS